MFNEIGLAAGKVWNVLKNEGELVITRLHRKTGMTNSLFYMGVGWLAREDKIKFRRERRTIFVSLKE